MFCKSLLKYTLLTGASIGSFIVGTYYGQANSKRDKFQKGFPIFETVFAATSFSPAVANEADVSRISQIMKHGFPSLDNVRSFDDFVLSYDRRNRVAHWVFEHLTKDNIKQNEGVDRSKCDFKPDESIHPYFR